MKPIRFISVILILVSLTLIVNNGRLFADEYDDLQHQKEAKEAELQKTLEEKSQTEKRKGTIVGEISAVGTKLETVNSQLERKKQELKVLENEIKKKEKERSEKEEVRATLLREWYKNYKVSPIELFLGAGSFSEAAQKLSGYKSAVLDGGKQIDTLNTSLSSLSKTVGTENIRKQKIEGEVASLSTQRNNLVVERKQVESTLSNLVSQMNSIESAIAGITARQDELIRQKLSATAYFTAVGESEQVKETIPDPPFSPAFAVISIGYPHRIGMSQYGAFGRSKAGQNYSAILSAYYQNFSIKPDYPVPATIEVEGFGRINFEDNYMFGIAEMPTSWAEKGGYEALKAQAIAARSYALAATGNGERPICPTQYCQVYNSGKVGDASASRWRDAVRETRGWVMVNSDGSPVKAYYASTAGGYTRLPTDFDVRWNTTYGFIKRIHDADSEGKAYDGPSYGDSPWYYKAWYSKANDIHPWLTKEEMVDLLNATLLSDSENSNLSHPTNGGWSFSQVVSAVRSSGQEPIDEIGSVQPVFSEEGYTMLLRVGTNRGVRDLDGKRFRKVFTLRSRGNLALWSSLFDIIKK